MHTCRRVFPLIAAKAALAFAALSWLVFAPKIAFAEHSVIDIASFGGSFAYHPFAGVTFDSNGNLYGTTLDGGANEKGTVYELAKGSNIITILASFNGINGANPVSGVIFDSSGNLFGMTSEGGLYGGGTVYEIVKGTRSITALASFNNTGGHYPFAGVTLDSNGNIFGTTIGGGANSYQYQGRRINCGRVFEIVKGSNTITTFASFNNTNGSVPYGGVTFDSNGNLYGTTVGGGTNDIGTVFEIARGTRVIKDVASFNKTNGAGPRSGVIFDSSGNLFGMTFADGANNKGTVFEIAKGTRSITVLAAFNKTSGYLPNIITLDSSGNLYGTTVGGGANNKGTVFEIAKGSNTITVIASFNGTNGDRPNGVTLDSNGDLYGTTNLGLGSATYNMGTVFEISKGSSTITTVASFSGYSGNYPVGGVTLDSSGNLYATNEQGGAYNEGGVVYEIAKGTRVITALASFNKTNGYSPDVVTLDSYGNLYGTTAGGGANNKGTVFEIVKGSNTITVIASFNKTDGDAPNGVTLDSSGNIFGTNNSGGPNNTGRVFEIAKGSSIITTFASFNGSNGHYPNGYHPNSVTFDSNGNLYGTTENGGVHGGGVIYEIAKGSNTITALASFSETSGLEPLSGVTLDSSGNLYGTTINGGANNDGTVFELPQGSDTIMALASFNKANEYFPFAGVTLDNNGNIFGTTQFGGTNKKGTVYEVAKGSSTITVIASFDGSNGAGPIGGVTFDSNGNLYGTTTRGGVNKGGVVFEIANAGAPLSNGK